MTLALLWRVYGATRSIIKDGLRACNCVIASALMYSILLCLTRLRTYLQEVLQQTKSRRALYNRWKKPGDKAKFKSISLTESTPMSSRFVMKENYLSIESVRLGYQFDSKWLKKALRISSLNINMYMNSIARFSTLEDERGLYYPFARSISFSLGAIL